mmetsp:Transcript_21968/g.32095  ORF Transcript_21968/g.32095 Transcript_21968/m.32095 type:complete len:177 (-) Transcript_21968:554-1084(-)
MRLSNGETPKIREISGVVSDMQHELTRVSGARPFGVTATVVGVDTVSMLHGNGSVGRPRLFQSEPGGIMEEYEYCAAGKGRTEAEVTLTELHARLVSSSSSGTTNNTTTIMEQVVEGVTNAVFDADDTNNTQRVDIWLIETTAPGGECRRGNARIRCAKAVSRTDLELVKRRFARG